MTKYLFTFTGKRINPEKPKPSDICIEDIAHALSYTNRYGGHRKNPISVAQHSIIVANQVLRISGSWSEAKAALLHDATEAYLCDLVSSVKALLPEYKKLEAKWARQIEKALNFKTKDMKLLERIDKQDVLKIEETAECESNMYKWLFKQSPETVKKVFLINYQTYANFS